MSAPPISAGVTMRALTLTQPWATLVAISAKRLETRSWTTTYRGPLAIHAAKTFPTGARGLCVPGPGFARSPFYDALRAAGVRGPVRDGRRCSTGDLPLGMVIATAVLTDVVLIDETFGADLHARDHDEGRHELAFGDYTPGRYAWLLDQVTPLDPPVPARGAQGLWAWRPGPAALPARIVHDHLVDQGGPKAARRVREEATAP